MALWSPPVAAAAAPSQTQLGSSCFFPTRSQSQPQQALLLPPLARKILNSLLALWPQPHHHAHGLLKNSNSSWRSHAVAAEVEGLNIAGDVTQAVELEAEAYPLLDELTTKSVPYLECTRCLKSKLVALTRRVQKVRDEIEQLMDDDGDMAEMYLTEKKRRMEGPLDAIRNMHYLLPFSCTLGGFP